MILIYAVEFRVYHAYALHAMQHDRSNTEAEQIEKSVYSEVYVNMGGNIYLVFY